MFKKLENREAQFKSAKMKTDAITSLIPELIDLHKTINENNEKPYCIILNYIKFDEYYKFNIDVKRKYSYTEKPLTSVNFSLTNLDDGLLLFNEIRDCYIENNEMVYTGFHSKDNTACPYDSYDAIGVNGFDLSYRINTMEEYEKLREFDMQIYRDPKISSKIMKKVNS